MALNQIHSTPTRSGKLLLETAQAIRNRQTIKVLSGDDLPAQGMGEGLDQLLDLAGWAPFHRACDSSHRSPDDSSSSGAIEPWRFHVLDAANCRTLRQRIPLEQAGKIPNMLAAADALILATWLPNPNSQPDLPAECLFEPSMANMEHIAAASAAIQNLLLAATAHGIRTYWSSGGVLRSAQVFELLGIPTEQILLGAVFFFPTDTGEADVVSSKLRASRSDASGWSRRINLG